ncbi:unnamed protein product [Diplocarpon coronariae]|uniref:Uncharacterized protein n=1 Tax=Diplocarpon coronariae TaxID=2795749 RepID=A0A218ZEQ2_9HELO|nr:hypothetical protein B2J93_1695 [Marssonina coronariae]
MVYIGKWDQVSFATARELPDVKVGFPTNAWSTTPIQVDSIRDVRTPIPPSAQSRIRSADLSGIAIPKYKKFNLFRLVNLQRHRAFRPDSQVLNDATLGPLAPDAAQMSILVVRCEEWNLAGPRKDLGDASDAESLTRKENSFSGGCDQQNYGDESQGNPNAAFESGTPRTPILAGSEAGYAEDGEGMDVDQDIDEHQDYGEKHGDGHGEDYDEECGSGYGQWDEDYGRNHGGGDDEMRDVYAGHKGSEARLAGLPFSSTMTFEDDAPTGETAPPTEFLCIHPFVSWAGPEAHYLYPITPESTHKQTPTLQSKPEVRRKEQNVHGKSNHASRYISTF